MCVCVYVMESSRPLPIKFEEEGTRGVVHVRINDFQIVCPCTLLKCSLPIIM